MNSLELVPTELIDIIISFLNYDNIELFLEILPYSNLINWYNIHKYHFGSHINLNKGKYIIYVAIESLKNKLNNTYLANKSLDEIYNLKTIILNVDRLTSIPKEIGKLTNLQGLYLNNNQLTKIPKEIGNLTNLRTLNLSYNQITSIPQEIGNLTNLKELYLYNNQITSIPKEIGKLTNLERLYLSNNQIKINDVPENLRYITII